MLAGRSRLTAGSQVDQFVRLYIAYQYRVDEDVRSQVFNAVRRFVGYRRRPDNCLVLGRNVKLEVGAVAGQVESRGAQHRHLAQHPQ